MPRRPANRFPEWENTLPIQYKRGSAPDMGYGLKVTREQMEQIKLEARRWNMSLAVYVEFLTRAFQEGRVIILPPGQNLDDVMAARSRAYAKEAVKEYLQEVMPLVQGGDFYRR